MSEAGLVLLDPRPFSEAEEQTAALALQQLGILAHGKGVQAAMAQLVCDQPRLQQAYQGDGLREAAAKPFLPLPIAALQPRIKVQSTGCDNMLVVTICFLSPCPLATSKWPCDQWCLQVAIHIRLKFSDHRVARLLQQVSLT